MFRLHRHEIPDTSALDLHLCKALASNQRDELALGLRIPLDVALGHRQAGMPGEFLHVAQAPPNLGHFARGAGNEGPAPGVRRTAIHLQGGIEPMEPQTHGRRRQPPTTLGEDDGPIWSRRIPHATSGA